MNHLDKQYQELLFDVIENGVTKETRNGKTKSLFGKQIYHDMGLGFPLLTTKKMYWKGIVTELLWFLRGDTDIRFLWYNNCSIWDGDWYKTYKTTCSEPYTLEEIKQKVSSGKHNFHNSMFDMGPIYGKQWRRWSRKTTREEKITTPGIYDIPVDQIQNLINDLKTNPDSRRLMVNAWNVSELNQMTLPPCHYGFQVYTRELSLEERRELVSKEVFDRIYNGGGPDTLSHSEINQWNVPTRAISLMWNQRSVDTFLGLPFNIASYALLLHIIAQAVNMIPDKLIGNLGDVHLYEDHLSQAREQITREPFILPKLEIDDQYWVSDCGLDTHILSMLIEDFKINDYRSHPTIKAPLIN
jgi:thymidylate synthase